jgi:anti-sigma-K factor RskA
MICEDCQELAGAYALDAITIEERRAVEEHIAQCPDCKHEMQELRSAANALPLVVPMVEPSPALKERILSTVAAHKQETIPLPIPRPASRTRRRKWVTPLLGVAAAVLLVLLSAMIVWNITLQQQLASLSRPVAIIEGTSTAPGVSGQLTYFPNQHLTVMIVHNLPALTGSQVYQGWFIQGKQPISIGLLNVQEGTATLDFAGEISHYNAAAVSREPGPQASLDQPQGPIIALAPLKT